MLIKLQYNKTRGLKLPPGCKISPCDSTISIEPNFATFNELTLVEFIKYNPKWPKNGPNLPIHVILHYFSIVSPFFAKPLYGPNNLTMNGIVLFGLHASPVKI